MNEHITFDEMAEFITATGITPEYMKLAARVNSHLVKCEDCRETYETLLKANDAFDEAISYVPVSRREKLRFFLALYTFVNKGTSVGVKLADCAEMKFKSFVKFKVQSFTELVYEKIAGSREFYHPAFAVSLMSNKMSEDEKDDDKSGVMKSTLVDDETNRVTVSLDRRISLFLNKSESMQGSLIALVPVDGTRGEPRFAYPMDYDEKKLVVRFTDVEPGEYIVACKE